MVPTVARQQLATARQSIGSFPQSSIQPASAVEVTALSAEKTQEVLAFLGQRPIHTVLLAGLIHENGLVSPMNRGNFYACRNQQGQLEGVALIGHATLMETRTDRGLEAFAALARDYRNSRMIMGEDLRIEEFLHYYCEDGQQERRVCSEILLEKRWPVAIQQNVPGLRLATHGDLDLVVPVQARLAFDESGVDPLAVDPNGFRRRCAWRIERGRTWVLIENERLIFKADVQVETPEVTYLEGVWIDPDYRNQDYGRRCMSQIERIMLQRTKAICLFVNAGAEGAVNFYTQTGYKLQATFDTVFLQTKESSAQN